MDQTEAKYREIRRRLFAVNLALEKTKKFENAEVTANLKRQQTEIKHELGKYYAELKQNGGKKI